MEQRESKEDSGQAGAIRGLTPVLSGWPRMGSALEQKRKFSAHPSCGASPSRSRFSPAPGVDRKFGIRKSRLQRIPSQREVEKAGGGRT